MHLFVSICGLGAAAAGDGEAYTTLFWVASVLLLLPARNKLDAASAEAAATPLMELPGPSAMLGAAAEISPQQAHGCQMAFAAAMERLGAAVGPRNLLLGRD